MAILRPARMALTTAAIVAGLTLPLFAQKGVLKGVTKIRVDDTLVLDEKKIKEDFAPELVKSSLRNAMGNSGFEVAAEAPVIAQVELREFSSGNAAMRIMVGFGSGRATIEADLVIRDLQGKHLARKTIKAKGNLAWSSYHASTTQRTQAFSAFEMRLLEEISRLK